MHIVIAINSHVHRYVCISRNPRCGYICIIIEKEINSDRIFDIYLSQRMRVCLLFGIQHSHQAINAIKFKSEGLYCPPCFPVTQHSNAKINESWPGEGLEN